MVHSFFLIFYSLLVGKNTIYKIIHYVFRMILKIFCGISEISVGH